jgi:S-adenosyl methyltransferase
MRFLVGEAGICQFIDIGTGLPTQGSVHEVAQDITPDARVIYVDYDPVVVSHAQALLVRNRATVAINGDLREPASIFSHADFASPLFHGLGYTAEHEAAGYRFDMWEGVIRRHVEADSVYFEDTRRSHTDGAPLVLVEVKGTDQPADAGKGQAQSYAYWIRPAYHVTTNGNVIVVYSYQAQAPDVKVLDIKRSELRDRFDDLYRVLNPKAAKAAWIARKEKFKELNHPAI